MKRVVMLCLGSVIFVGLSWAQQPAAANAVGVVPPLVSFSGVLADIDGKPVSGVAGVTFLLYRDEQGGAPLWMETQNVEALSTRGYKAFSIFPTDPAGAKCTVSGFEEAR